MKSGSGATFKWLGAAHHRISYKGLTIVIDPLYMRLPGDKPHLEEKPEDLENIDYLLLMHGCLDHARDFPQLALRHGPEVFAPAECMADLEKEERKSGLRFDRSKWSNLEDCEGATFTIACMKGQWQNRRRLDDLDFRRKTFYNQEIRGRIDVGRECGFGSAYHGQRHKRPE